MYTRTLFLNTERNTMDTFQPLSSSSILPCFTVKQNSQSAILCCLQVPALSAHSLLSCGWLIVGWLMLSCALVNFPAITCELGRLRNLPHMQSWCDSIFCIQLGQFSLAIRAFFLKVRQLDTSCYPGIFHVPRFGVPVSWALGFLWCLLEKVILQHLLLWLKDVAFQCLVDHVIWVISEAWTEPPSGFGSSFPSVGTWSSCGSTLLKLNQGALVTLYNLWL